MVNGYFPNPAPVHGVVETSNLLATTRGGHIYSVKAGADIDNGKIVNLDAMSCIKTVDSVKSYSHEYFTMVAPTATSRVGLIASVAIGPDEKPYAATKESAFYNAEGELMRVYDLYFGDKFVVSEGALTGTAAVGNYVVADGYDMKAQAAKPADTVAFVGEIIDKIVKHNGGTPTTFYKILVRKNG